MSKAKRGSKKETKKAQDESDMMSEVEEKISLMAIGESYRPQNFSDLPDDEPTTVLRRICKSTGDGEGMPHILIFGAPGSGKMTRILIMLREFFKGVADPFAVQARAINEETGSFCHLPGTGKSAKNQKAFLAFTSRCHCEIDMNQPGIKKGMISFLDQFSRNKNISLDTHKYLVLQHADRLHPDVQAAFRRILETRSTSLRLLITCTSLGRWMGALRSRFLCVRIPAPRDKEAEDVLRYYGNKLKWKLTAPRIKSIINVSRVGGLGSVDFNEMLLSAQISFEKFKKDKKFTVYEPDRYRAGKLLYISLKEGDREKMRTILEDIYLAQPDEFRAIITGDLKRLLFANGSKKSTEKGDLLRHKIIQTIAEWDSKMGRPDVTHVLLLAEGLLFNLADILGR